MEIAPINIVHSVTKAVSKHPLRFGIYPSVRAHPATELTRAQSDEQKLLSVTGKSHNVLFKAKTVFPFDLFQDTVTVDREKLSIINRIFFWTAKIISVPVRDILSIEADIGPFFGSIHITSRYYPVNPYSINFLSRKNTLKLRRLLQGYIIAHERDIDCSEIPTKELVYLLHELGQGDIT